MVANKYWKIFELYLKILEAYGQILGKYWKVSVICSGRGGGQQSMKQGTTGKLFYSCNAILSSALKFELTFWHFLIFFGSDTCLCKMFVTILLSISLSEKIYSTKVKM